MPRKKRKWTPRELRLLTEWVEQNFPNARRFYRVRLGRYPEPALGEVMTEEEKKMMTLWRRWADAVVIDENKIYVIEAAIRPDLGDISKLDIYAHLLTVTPEFEPYLKGRIIEKVLLYAVPDPIVLYFARLHGIRTVYYCPDWIKDYVKKLYTKQEW